MTIRTGIGGWTYPEWRKGAFYPEGLAQKRELEWASRQLGAIEINGTYHSLQKPESFRKWHEATPEGFVFAVKGSSYITNRKVLASAGEAMVKFYAQGLDELGDRLGPILWQLMGTKKFDPEDIAAFFALLPRELKGLPLRYAIEVGHESFACAEFVQPLAVELLHRFARAREDLAVADVRRALHREDEPFGRRLAPFAEALGLLQAVIRAVDLDRPELARGPFELTLLDQTFGIEGSLAPVRVSPAADTCANCHAPT